jgi:hypothetical protein
MKDTVPYLIRPKPWSHTNSCVTHNTGIMIGSGAFCAVCAEAIQQRPAAFTEQS